MKEIINILLVWLNLVKQLRISRNNSRIKENPPFPPYALLMFVLKLEFILVLTFR